MIKKSLLSTYFFGFLILYPGISGAELEPKKAQLRITAEEINLPGDEKMGLVGGNYLVHSGRSFYMGLGIYGAVTGMRGGFFTGGLEMGMQKPLGNRWLLDFGLFAGGGGGGGAPQGGGLMLRPHAGILYKTDIGNFGVNVSRVKFPNGSIDSSQVSLSYEKPFLRIAGSHWLSGDRVYSTMSDFERYKGTEPATQDFSFSATRYVLPAGTTNTSGAVQDSDMSLLGVTWDHYLNDRYFLRLDTAGAFGGGSDGFAQVLLGAGLRKRFSQHTSGKIALSVGGAGGGAVDTGGGFIAELSAGLQYRFDNGLLVGLQGGVVEAPDGDFRASRLSLNFGLSDEKPRNSPMLHNMVEPRHWRMRVIHQTYDPTGDTRRKGMSQPDDRKVSLVGINADLMLTRNWYVTGQALGAYDGGAGGYAAGLVGVGGVTPLWKNGRIIVNGEVLLGASGGGGIAVGDGFIVQTNIGIGYLLSRATALHLSYGTIQASNGTFEADVTTIGFSYRYTTLKWK